MECPFKAYIVNQNYIENEDLVSTVDFRVQSAVSWERSIEMTTDCVCTIFYLIRLVSMGIAWNRTWHGMESGCLIPMIGLHQMNRKGRKVALSGDPK